MSPLRKLRSVTLRLPVILEQIAVSYIQHKPLVPAIAIKQLTLDCPDLWLKLDWLQVTESF
ncbi:hypothetical protein [Nodosilinea sp. FACHB-13]|uniref:hypothetical protein n=1 Tax=Cyanophyceae TaxID=3028117 RepID=UPI0016845A0B|nr:hypothetical protein [Nodosilinea sp. FACHB-13]MBD2109346.1 hypothetical protein [Nodosilinea sp. FACHB-13]